MNVKPLFDRVVIKPLKNEEQKTESGILLVSNSQEKPCIATVCAVGDGGNFDGQEIKMIVKPGDKVLFSKYAGTEFKYENEDYIILKQSEILALIQ